MNDIEIKSICKAYGENQVLKDLSLSFPKGKVTCIMGQSGCGKTTLLRILAGLEKPDSGTVEGIPEKLSFVFQDDRLCEDFSAVSNLRFVTGRAKPKSETVRHLNELGLGDSLKKPVRELSGGMKRRVAIARAICYESELVILDEPFKGLDDELKKEVIDYVLKYTSEKTVIIVTHDESEAEYIGGRIIRFSEQKR